MPLSTKFTATAEAMLMAYSAAKKADTVLVSSTVDPKTLHVVRTYARFHGVSPSGFRRFQIWAISQRSIQAISRGRSIFSSAERPARRFRGLD